MAKKNANEKPKNLWYRLITFAEENQKVIWVLLLLIMAPTFAMTGLYTQAFTPKDDSRVFTQVFGQKITNGEIKKVQESLQNVQGHILAVARTSMEPLSGALGSGSGQTLYSDLDPIDYFVYKQKALDLGLRVSDEELRETIRDLWQRQEAAVRAQNDMDARPKPKTQNPNDYAQFFERLELTKKKLTELQGEGGKIFDPQGWVESIEGKDPGHRRIAVHDFEEMLRDVILIAKLESFVTTGVQVTPQEVFSEYNKENQARKLSWVELKVPDAVRERIAKSLKPEEVKAHYDGQKRLFQKGTSIRSSWLILPKAQFKSDAEKAVNDEDLLTYYKDNRNEFRKPALLAAEADFALRSVDEKAKYESELYRPLAEVKDKVREKVIEERTKTDLRTFTDKIRQRIFPAKTGDAAKAAQDKPAVSFDELVKEFPFLKTGTTGFVERKKAKDAFGAAYSPAIDGWFSTLDQRRPLTPPRTAQATDEGQVFYAKVESRPSAYIPAFTEIESEVRESLARQRILDEIEKELKKASEAKKDIASLASGVDVMVGGEAVHVDAAPAQSSLGYVAKTGTLMVPRKDAEKKPDEKKATFDEDEEDQESANAGEEAHPSSKAIVEAAFKLPDAEKGQTSVATDLEAGTAYIVRFDDLKLPDPAKFEDRSDAIERQLRSQQASTVFSEWKKKLLEQSRA